MQSYAGHWFCGLETAANVLYRANKPVEGFLEEKENHFLYPMLGPGSPYGTLQLCTNSIAGAGLSTSFRAFRHWGGGGGEERNKIWWQYLPPWSEES